MTKHPSVIYFTCLITSFHFLKMKPESAFALPSLRCLITVLSFGYFERAESNNAAERGTQGKHDGDLRRRLGSMQRHRGRE